MAVCRGYQCTSTDLIKAHIVPRGFAKDVRGSQAHNWLISVDKVRHTQLGVVDRTFSAPVAMGSWATSTTTHSRSLAARTLSVAMVFSRC
jgi:hypothetical protein